MVEAVLALEKSLLDYNERIHTLETQLLGNSLHSFANVDIPVQLDEARAQQNRIQDALRRKKAALGVESLTLLQELSGSEYLRLRMNARALKQRTRDRLRQRKFELERLEKAYRHTVNGAPASQ